MLVDSENGAVEVFERGEHVSYETPARVTLNRAPELEFRLGELFDGLFASGS